MRITFSPFFYYLITSKFLSYILTCSIFTHFYSNIVYFTPPIDTKTSPGTITYRDISIWGGLWVLIMKIYLKSLGWFLILRGLRLLICYLVSSFVLTRYLKNLILARLPCLTIWESSKKRVLYLAGERVRIPTTLWIRIDWMRLRRA